MKNVVFKTALLFLSAFILYSEETAGKILESMSRIDRISQIFLVNVEGNSRYHPVEFLADGKAVVPGGVLLFSYNIADSFDAVKSYIDSINDFYIKNGNPLPYIAVDQEGGAVNRLRGITAALPSQRTVAGSYGFKDARELYSAQAEQMHTLGISMNLAPVAEASHDFNREFLGGRSFGDFPSAVTYSILCIDSYESGGIGAVAKHFPGNTNTDPHTGLPEITASFSDVMRDYVLPFAFVLSSEPSGVLMSHARVSSADDRPACMSAFWIKDILQGKLGFTGLVISDDIFMGALSDSTPESAAVQAVLSGVDVIMLSEKKFLPVAEKLLEFSESDTAFKERLFEAEKKVVEFKIKKGILSEKE